MACELEQEKQEFAYPISPLVLLIDFLLQWITR